jgi:hypothetical protein
MFCCYLKRLSDQAELEFEIQPEDESRYIASYYFDSLRHFNTHQTSPAQRLTRENFIKTDDYCLF